MNLNDLLADQDIDPKQVLVFRHRPWETKLNEVLPWLAAERPDLYNAYQQTQNEKVEKAMQKARYVASFLRHSPGKALFVGLYSVDGWKSMTFSACARLPLIAELTKLGGNGFVGEPLRPSILWFDLTMLESFYANWKGKLIVNWPPPERSWWRWADRNEFRVAAVLEDDALTATMPPWDELCLTWEKLAVLPKRWEAVLGEWRGVYYIFDTDAGMGYIGAAYGTDNLLGRWRDYAAAGHGGNKLLRNRDPKHFQFALLQRVSPDMPAADVIRLESTWKKRLHTRTPFGLNDN